MSLLADNTRRWKVAKFKPSQLGRAKAFANRAIAKKPIYERLVARIWREHGLHIPWWIVPLIHERECLRGTENMNCSIGQGSPWNVKSKIKPYSGPFSSWEEAAVDSLVKQHPYAAKWNNWSGGGAMTIMEAYNGLGYAKRGKPSPYIWAQSDQYVKGKYVADGKYDPEMVDPQLGVAISLHAMMDLDPSIVLDGDMPKQDTTPRKTETLSVGSIMSAALAWINTNPWFVLTWLDVSLILFGTAVAAGVVVYYVNKHKRVQLQ